MNLRFSPRAFWLVFFIFLSSCANSNSLDSGSTNPDGDVSIGTPATDGNATSIASVTIAGDSVLELNIGEALPLSLTAVLDDGESFSGITTTFDSNDAFPTTDTLWFTNDDTVADISTAGVVTAIDTGSTYIKVTVYNRSDTIEIIVINPNDDSNTSVTPAAPRALADLAFASKPLTQNRNDSQTLQFAVRFADDDSTDTLTWDELDGVAECLPELDLSNTSVATLDDGGVFRPLSYGVVSTSVACGDLADTWTVRVNGDVSPVVVDDNSDDDVDDTPPETSDDTSDDTTDNIPDDSTNDGSDDTTEAPVDLKREDPDTISDAFLGSDDLFAFYPADGATYGQDKFPDNIYGPPESSRTDVVSFGNGGFMIIELKGYVIVNDSGADFTIFENPFSGWTERATVAVSSDGISYTSFPCDPFDPEGVYEGCAGVNEINYSEIDEDMLDPSSSGGDTYDLATIDAPEPIRYIKITDDETCTSPPLCTSSAGFDLDAIGIINGIND
jgi:hypothetical protein